MKFMHTHLLKNARLLSDSRIQRSFDVIKCWPFSYEFKNDIEPSARWISRVFVTRPLHSMPRVYSILYTVFHKTPILMRFPPHKFSFNYSYLKNFKNKISVKLCAVEFKLWVFNFRKMYLFIFCIQMTLLICSSNVFSF